MPPSSLAHVHAPFTHWGAVQRSPGSPQQVPAGHALVGVRPAGQTQPAAPQIGSTYASLPQKSEQWKSCGCPTHSQMAPSLQT